MSDTLEKAAVRPVPHSTAIINGQTYILNREDCAPGVVRATPLSPRVPPDRLEAERIVRVGCYPEVQVNWIDVMVEPDLRDLAEGLSLILARREMRRSAILLTLTPGLVSDWLYKRGGGYSLRGNCPHQSVILAGRWEKKLAGQYWLEWVPEVYTDGTRVDDRSFTEDTVNDIIGWQEDIDLARHRRTRYPVLCRLHWEFPAAFGNAAPDARMGFRQKTDWYEAMYGDDE